MGVGCTGAGGRMRKKRRRGSKQLGRQPTAKSGLTIKQAHVLLFQCRPHPEGQEPTHCSLADSSSLVEPNLQSRVGRRGEGPCSSGGREQQVTPLCYPKQQGGRQGDSCSHRGTTPWRMPVPTPPAAQRSTPGPSPSAPHASLSQQLRSIATARSPASSWCAQSSSVVAACRRATPRRWAGSRARRCPRARCGRSRAPQSRSLQGRVVAHRAAG